MKRYDALMQRIRDGGRILIDGAMSSEIDRRCLPEVKNAWNGGRALTDPDILRQIHEDYIRSGAQIVISNTFATARHVLRDAGWEEHFEFLNRRSVELAREARSNMQTPDVLVAGSISHWSWGEQPSHDELRANISEQAAIMAAAGADLIMLEMMINIERTLILIDAAQKSGLPVWVGFSCEVDEQEVVRLLEGARLEEAIEAIQDKNLPLVSIMHTKVEYIDASLDVLQAHRSTRRLAKGSASGAKLSIGVYANTGRHIGPKWMDMISPEEYASAAERWLARGVQVIGGCCGIGPEHIALLKNETFGIAIK